VAKTKKRKKRFFHLVATWHRRSNWQQLPNFAPEILGYRKIFSLSENFCQQMHNLWLQHFIFGKSNEKLNFEHPQSASEI